MPRFFLRLDLVYTKSDCVAALWKLVMVHMKKTSQKQAVQMNMSSRKRFYLRHIFNTININRIKTKCYGAEKLTDVSSLNKVVTY